MELVSLDLENSNIVEEVSGETVVQDLQTALDLVGNAYYQGADGVILSEENLGPDFFRLESGLAGELLQKFAQYGLKLAIVGDFDKYGRRSLDALVRESNRGSQVSFVPDRETAIARLMR